MYYQVIMTTNLNLKFITNSLIEIAMFVFTHTHTHIYIYIYICIYIYVYLGSISSLIANFIKHNRHFMSTYFLLDPFEK